MTRCLLVVLGLLLAVATARADDPAVPRLGIGFHGTRAPVGVRWWYTADAAADLGFGFQSTVDFNGLRLNRYVVQAGFPFALHRWDRVTAAVRPGFEYALEDQSDFDTSVDAYRKVQDHVIQAAIELEAEAFVTDHLSISGAIGAAMAHREFGAGGEATSWALTGTNFTNIGFHLYFGDPR